MYTLLAWFNSSETDLCQEYYFETVQLSQTLREWLAAGVADEALLSQLLGEGDFFLAIYDLVTQAIRSVWCRQSW